MLAKKNGLDEYVELYTADLFSWALHKVSDSETAKDLVQDTFLAAAEKIDGFRGDSNPKTWLISILNNKIVDFYRKKMKQPVKVEEAFLSRFFTSDHDWRKDQMPSAWEEDVHLLDDHAFLQVLSECLSALPEKWSNSVKLKYLLSKKGEEICQELGITPTNLWQIIHRAKLQLRECLEINWFKN